MIRYLKFALIWFIAVALPVQGFAAATMRCCRSNQIVAAPNGLHHSNASVAQGFNIKANYADMKVISVSVHHDRASISMNDEMDPVPDAKSDAKAKCSLCTASCHGVAVVPEPLHEMPTPEPPGLTVASFYPSQFACHIPGTPQRPPLSLFFFL